MSVETKKILEINSWSDFFSYVNSLKEKEKGDLFEFLTKQILIAKPEYCSKIKNVWLYNEIPTVTRDKLNLPSRDEGIDIVAETFQGQYWAIQCKFKGHNQSPTYKELSTFSQLANNYCKNISLALLVHTGERGVRKSHLLGEKYSEIGLEFWLGLTEEDWIRIQKSIKHQSVRPKLRKPRPHQQLAINGAVKHYLENKATRGRLIMPCGTGKSLTAFWIANTLKAKSIIVAVPSLSLIKQSLEDWTREFLAQNENPRPEWLVICSDESTSKLEKDEFVSEAYYLGIPTTTNIDEIHSFLAKKFDGRKIIFTTYQSSDKLAQVAKKFHFSFDLAVLDEAHKTVGIKTNSFATLLLEKNINIQRRLCMTATERIFKGDNDEVLSMDDPEVYGNLFYQLSFKEAIHSDPPIISEYKILTITVTNDEIEQLIAKNKLLSDRQKQIEEQDSQSLAAAIALRKVIQNYGIKHSISFHRSIKGADSFSDLHKKLNETSIDDIVLQSYHISSKKSAGERARLMNDFVNINPSLMTNARCLTEGVDVPAIDCVLFADPKQSNIDIVQSSGRALRPFAGKEYGYIMLPLIIPDGVGLEEFTDSTPFRKIGRIIAALSTQDETIAEEFRAITAGRHPGNGKIMVDGNVPVELKISLADFAEKINAKIWERVAKINWRPFLETKAFIQSLQLSSASEFREYCFSGNKPYDIPSNPHCVYIAKGWENWGDFLGTYYIADIFKEYLPFEDARTFVRKLRLRNDHDWREYCKSGKKPENIPSNPDNTYFEKGWLGIGDWLGTNKIANAKKKFLSFNEARAFCWNLNLRNYVEWCNYRKLGDKPNKIPSNPDIVYKRKGWVGWGDWLGTNVQGTRSRDFLTFQKARKFVHGLNLKSSKEWRYYCLSGKKPENIPANPSYTYVNKGWLSFGDWLGTGYIADQHKEYRLFDDARDFVHSLHLKTFKEWKTYCKSGEKPIDIPAVPHNTYKKNGWSGWGDWLGTGTISSHSRKFLSFFEARKFAHSLNFKSRSEWVTYCKSGKKPENIPVNPSSFYKDKGWSGMGDWLGTGTTATFHRTYRGFMEAREYVHSLNLKSAKEWSKFCKSGEKPIDIPITANRVYKNKGWTNWSDWLGK